MSEILLLLTY